MDGLFGDYEEIRKSGLFDAEYYLAANPDVAARNIDPLVHFIEEGARQGRNPNPSFDTAFYLEQCRGAGETPANPLLHYLRGGAARGLATKPGIVAHERASPATATAATRPPVLLAIDLLGVTAQPAGGLRLTIGGWALAAAPIVDITAMVDGEFGALAACGLARPDVARLHPDRAGAGASGFVLALDLPAPGSAVIEPMLWVRTASGEVGRRPLRVEIPPRELEVGVVDPMAGARDARPVGNPAMRLHISRAEVDASGILSVEGWVVCRVRIERIVVSVDGLPPREAEFGRTRDDLPATLRGHPNSKFSGFRFVAALGPRDPGGVAVTVRAMAAADIAAEASTTLTVARRIDAAAFQQPFRHHLDAAVITTAGRVALRGWTAGPSPLTGAQLLRDGVPLGEAEIGLPRPEIGNLFPELPHARQGGFAFDGVVGGPGRGTRGLTLRLCCADGTHHDVRLGGPAPAPRLANAADSDPDLKLALDTPEIVDGAAGTPVRGNLHITGWALARAGVERIEIACDGTRLGLADYGARRLDIGAAFPDWGGSVASGFTALIPHRQLPKGNRVVTVTLHDSGGRAVSVEFAVTIEARSETSGPWSLRRAMPPAESALGLDILRRSGRQPAFVAVLPVKGGAARGRAALTIASLRCQVYPNWRLLLLNHGGRLASGDAVDCDERVDLVEALTLDAVLRSATAAAETFLTVLAPGDELGVDALLELALAAAIDAKTDFLYSDERRRDPGSGTVEAFFKPRWSPDLLLSSNYIGRLWCVRGDLLRAVAEPEALLRHGEYDLVLRCTERAAAIRHVPAVLCEAADGGLDSAAQIGRSLARALTRRGIAGEIVAGPAAGTCHVRRAVTQPAPVSIIIQTAAADGVVETCIASLRRLTAYRNYEIVCIENIPAERHRWKDWLRRNVDRVIATGEDFNWSRFNNLAAAEARGEYLLFLNDDVEVIDPDWLDVLVSEAQRPEVGAVGPLLLYPDRRVQHAGMFLAAMGQARHAFRYAADDAPGYFGLARTQRNVIAVTGACLMTRRATFDALGGFDEAHGVINNDIDYCLRAWRRGLVNVYTPHARLIHREAVSRAALADAFDATRFEDRWREVFLAGDPYFSPHLSISRDDVAIEDEPTRLIVGGRPLICRSGIRTILVVKLDHIGDCVIAFPALRRLKQHFPTATITVLTSHASRAVWSLEPCVDRTIAFDFFRPRSADGEVELADEDWRGLRERLAGEQFDLAVDLRKHPETRPVLRHTGARYTAGFDFRNRFAWLDVALEWSGDQIYARKRQHNGDDLVNLVDAIAAACDHDRRPIASPPPAVTATAADRPLVCVHAGAGNEMKQWPAEYFAAVIDRLVKADGARIVLVGGPGEESVATRVLDRVRSPSAVTSLVGTTALADLPGILAGASLFLGNDSGPKHLAAGLGVPTVGVHGGTVDVREWAPVGPTAIAVAREVVCSPCYLSEAADCRRGLACIRELPPAQVYAACKRLLLLRSPPAAAGVTPAPPRRPPRRSPRLRRQESP